MTSLLWSWRPGHSAREGVSLSICGLGGRMSRYGVGIGNVNVYVNVYGWCGRAPGRPPPSPCSNLRPPSGPAAAAGNVTQHRPCRERSRLRKLSRSRSRPFQAQTLKRNNKISPSSTTYSFPSDRISPLSFAAFCEPSRSKSAKASVSARMKPRSKSVWISPAAWGARLPRRMVQARTSFSPAVKKEIRPSSS
jgi:hypothetical protein